MACYLIIISIAIVLIALGNFLGIGTYTPETFFWPLLATVIGTVVVILIDGLLAFLARRLPEKWFQPEAKAFNVSKGEKKLYKKMKIEKWKKFVPELGGFTGFHKDKIDNPFSSKYLARFLLESNYGVLGHVLGSILGFLVILLCLIPAVPFTYFHPLGVGLPIGIINMIMSHLPTMILRYNTPSLRSLYKKSLAKEERQRQRQREEEQKVD